MLQRLRLNNRAISTGNLENFNFIEIGQPKIFEVHNNIIGL
jgi:hypothetical protein